MPSPTPYSRPGRADVSQTKKEIDSRRTFAIISHPDAGKTTVTEKLLLLSGAINTAGTVKARKSQRHATSDWMEIEQQRGISVTSSVMQFEYDGRVVNLLDTPGHEDFSEDTYRTLTAVDSALMVIDAAKGVEDRTIKLLEICRLRKTPVITLINKMDRHARESLDLIDEIENVLDIQCAPITWPSVRGSISAAPAICCRTGSFRLIVIGHRTSCTAPMIGSNGPTRKRWHISARTDSVEGGDWEMIAEQDPIDWRGKGALDPVRLESYALHLNDFVDGILEGRPPTITGWDGRQAVAAALAAYESNETGKEIRLI